MNLKGAYLKKVSRIFSKSIFVSRNLIKNWLQKSGSRKFKKKFIFQDTLRNDTSFKKILTKETPKDPIRENKTKASVTSEDRKDSNKLVSTKL